jgi:hypothetical protein
VRADRTVGHLEEGDVEPGNGMGPERSITADEIELFIKRHLREEIVHALFDGLWVVADELRGTEDARREKSSSNDGARDDSERTAHTHWNGSGVWMKEVL